MLRRGAVTAARAFRLDFVPLRGERFDFSLRREFVDLPAVRSLLEVLQRASLRRKIRDACRLRHFANGPDGLPVGATWGSTRSERNFLRRVLRVWLLLLNVAIFVGRIQDLESARHNLRDGSSLSLAVFPSSGLKTALDEHVTSLMKIVSADLSQSAERHDADPLDPLLSRPGRILPLFVDRHAELRDGLPVRREFQLRCTAQKTKHHHSIQSLLRHGALSFHPQPSQLSLLWAHSVMVKGMDWRDRITVDPRILVGKPVVKGTRIAVEMVVDLLAAGWTHQQILDSYPTLTEEDVRACLAYASEVLHSEKVYPIEIA